MATGSYMFAQKQLSANIESASSVVDLVNILKHFSLSSIKEFMNQQIAQKTPEEINEIYRDTVSIQDVFSSDVQQHILSFDDNYHCKAVCKQWKLLSENNENNKMRKLYGSTIIPPSSRETGSTFIVHPKRRHLNAVEIDLGYKGPMGLSEALLHCNDRDRLLIHDGKYSVDSWHINQSLQVVGVGQNVIFEQKGTGSLHFVTLGHGCTGKNVKFENLSFCIDKEKAHYCIFIYQPAIDCNFALVNCRFMNMDEKIVITNMSKSKLNIFDCSFENARCAIWQRLSNAELKVQQCLFKNCGLVSDNSNDYWSAVLIGGAVKSNLRCIGNTFEDNVTHPIVRNSGNWHAMTAMEPSDLYLLKDNVVKGNNQFNGQIFDANTIYQS